MIGTNQLMRALEHHQKQQHHEKNMSKNMSKSSKSHHQAGAGAANLAFGIDHILSSSSASPMKQVQQAMASFSHQNNFNLPHQQHHASQQQMSQYHQQQQQAAAMQLMFNSATRVPAATSSAPGLPNQQDLFNGAALNEQLALLAAASQHQQQQHQHSLLNPATLAAAAQAQQHLQWQYQQQQLMTAAAAAAAAAAASQQRQQVAPPNPLSTLGSLGALSSLNALAAAQNQNLSATTNTNPATSQTTEDNSPAASHLFSCFMASMLLQQRQQQQAQKEQGSQHHASPLEHQHAQAMLSNQLAPFMAAPGAVSHLSASMNSDTQADLNHQNHHRSPSSSTTSTNSPIKQFLGDKSSPSILDQHHSELNSSLHRFTSRISASSPSANANNTRHQSGQVLGQSNLTGNRTSGSSSMSKTPNGFKASQHRATSSGTSSVALAAAAAAAGNSTNNDATDADDECGGTALSSLSDFVSKSLAPILDEFNNNNNNNNNNSQKQRTSAAQRSLMSNSHQQRISNNNNNNSIHSSASESSVIADDDANNNNSGNRKSASSRTNGDSNILNAVASALKGAGAANPIAETKTINTAIARAPPELVQKQPAWVFCTRYSDRPSSGPRTRRAKSKDKKPRDTKLSADEKRPRTAFTSEQLEKLRLEFQENSYLDEKRRKSLADRLCLNENQIKIWFQNKRAKMKKQSNQPNPLRGLLVAGGLYNHSTATSDCSESYANGQADDVGNRRMRDFDVEPSEAGADDGAPPPPNSDDERGQHDENRHQTTTTTASNQQAARKVNHSIENLHKDQLNDKARPTGGHNNDSLKRPRLSADETHEDHDERRNNNSPRDSSLKRVKLNHHQSERELEVVSAGSSPAPSEPLDEEPVISVS